MFIQVFKKAFLICSLCLNQYPILNKIPEKEGISLPVQKLEAYPKVETSNLVKKKPKKKVEFNKYQLIADTAKAQIGVYQDCTMLVTNSLAAVGIYFHGWPEEYSALGEWTNSPIPGDLIIYSGHIAIYVGDGMAVHGGWMGYTTVLSTVECTNPLIGYIHVYE